MRLIEASPKNGHSACGSPTARLRGQDCEDCGAHKVLDPEPRGYSKEEKELVYRAYHKRESKRAINRIFGVSRNTLTRWLKKRQLERDEKSTR